MAAILTSDRHLSERQARTGSRPSFGQRLWAAMEALGRRRAAPHIEALAYACRHSDPELARHLRAAAQELRAS